MTGCAVVRDRFATPGVLVMPVTAQPSSFPFIRLLSRISGMKRRSGAAACFRRILHQFPVDPVRRPDFLKPCDSIVERTFPVFVDLLNIGNRGSLVQVSALLMRRPEGLIDENRVSVK
jgi:hypothetical protein